jgi:branched-subunit amino acid transport protein
MMPDVLVMSMVAVAILGTYGWRFIGVLVAGRIEEGSPLFSWITCVAYSIAAGLMMKLLVLPTGALANTSFMDRTIAFITAVTVFYLAKRRLVPALLVGTILLFVLVSFSGAT